MHRLLLLLTCLLYQVSAWAESFTAYVDKSNYVGDEVIYLRLELHDAHIMTLPDFSILKDDFSIVSHRQSSRIHVINGKVTNLELWNIGLAPRKKGVITIPSLSIKTIKQQVLSTAPITIEVGEGGQYGAITAEQSKDSLAPVEVKLVLNRQTAYVNQPVVGRLLVTLRDEVHNLRVNDFSIKDAIVERIGDLETSEQGQKELVQSINYIITPVRAGIIDIPRVEVVVSIPHREELPDPFLSGLFSNFDLHNYKEVMVSSSEQSLNVKEAKQELPLKSFNIKEEWDIDIVLRVGNPISRKVVMEAHGMVGNKLPGIMDKFDVDGLRSYSDQPFFDNKIVAGEIVGKRVDNYTIIPQNEGSFTIPAVSIKWLNIKTDKIEETKLPAKVVTILPAHDVTTPPQEPKMVVQEGKIPNVFWHNIPSYIYVMGAIFLSIMIIMIVFMVRMKRELAHMKRDDASKTKQEPLGVPNLDVTLHLNKLTTLDSVSELYDIVRGYIVQRWQLDNSYSIRHIAAFFSQQYPELTRELESVFLELDEARFFQTPLDIAGWIMGYKILLSKLPNLDEEKQIKPRVGILPDLNP